MIEFASEKIYLLAWTVSETAGTAAHCRLPNHIIGSQAFLAGF